MIDRILLWRPLPGDKHHRYSISDTGVVWDEWRHEEVPQHFNSSGYRTVKGKTVHRLVLQAFEREPEPEEQACHLNGIFDDNRRENLIWAYLEVNEQHRHFHNHYGRVPYNASWPVPTPPP